MFSTGQIDVWAREVASRSLCVLNAFYLSTYSTHRFNYGRPPANFPSISQHCAVLSSSELITFQSTPNACDVQGVINDDAFVD
jgi:hypothetical protein